MVKEKEEKKNEKLIWVEDCNWLPRLVCGSLSGAAGEKNILTHSSKTENDLKA